MAPVIGAPDAVAKQLAQQLTASLAARQIAVAQPGEAAPYTLRGYVVSARERTNTKISYIWDLTDTAGKRVNRITGEEIASAGDSRDPWSAVTPQLVQAISEKTAGSLAAWLPTQAAAPAVAGSGAALQPIAASGSAAATQAVAQAGQSAQQLAAAGQSALSGPTTGSIARAGSVSAIVPSVTGAPGDGGISLTKALQTELTRNGVAVASAGGGQTYRVEGRVKVGAGEGGKQPIQIDWDVKDPAGKKLGTVSQKNEIPQGSLDGAWGKTADAAAAAAAQGILKLLPGGNQTAAN